MKRRVPIPISIIAVAGLMSITVFWHGLLAVYIFNLFFAAIRKFGISLIVVL
jgi:hypothetical protein